SPWVASSAITLAISSPWAVSDCSRVSIRPRLISFSTRAPITRIKRPTKLRMTMSRPRREPTNGSVNRRCSPRTRGSGSAFAVTASDGIEGLDRVEVRIELPELLAHALDVTVDGAVVDVDLVVVGGVHQVVAALHETGTLGQRLQQQELGHRQFHRLAFPH